MASTGTPAPHSDRAPAAAASDSAYCAQLNSAFTGPIRCSVSATSDVTAYTSHRRHEAVAEQDRERERRRDRHAVERVAARHLDRQQLADEDEQREQPELGLRRDGGCVREADRRERHGRRGQHEARRQQEQRSRNRRHRRRRPAVGRGHGAVFQPILRPVPTPAGFGAS